MLTLIMLLIVSFVGVYTDTVAVDPVRPSLIHGGIGEDHFNVSFVPGTYDELTERPIGNEFYIKYRETNIDSAWKVVRLYHPV